MTTNLESSASRRSRPARAPTPAALERLRATIRGQLVTSDHPAYDQARAVYNGMIDRFPAVIVRCVDDADVISAVSVARDHSLPLAVRGGGHGAPGYAVVDDGLVVDLSPMRHVVIDAGTGRAVVGGGATWGDVDHATAPFGCAVPGGIVSTTGVGGLTLGGGTGHLTRPFGLTCDSLIAANLVTADGRLVRASEDSHPELFWAIRGGGGNFGVVTSFEFELHRVGPVLGGPIVYDVAAAGELMREWDHLIGQAPDQLNAFFGLHLAPPLPFLPPEHHGRPVCLLATCWTGDHGEGRDVLRPLLEHRAVLGADLATMPLATLNAANDVLAPAGMLNYWRGLFVGELTDDLIEVYAKYAPTVPNISSVVHLYPIDGAAGRVPPDATAFSHRDARYSTIIGALWDEPDDTAHNIRWVRECWDALHAIAPAGGYVNFLPDEDGDTAVRATYRQNYERLSAVKLAYDAENLFCRNQNILPAPSGR